MLKSVKLATMLGLSLALITAGAATISATSRTAVEAIHVCNGVHYTERQDIAGGCKEYWVCCECHQHYLEEPKGNWVDAGQATEHVSSYDDRYLTPSVEGLQEQVATGEITVEEAKEQAEENCGVILNDELTEVVDVVPGTQNVIIPEGVTDIQTNWNPATNQNETPFTGNSEIKSIEVPATFDSFSWHDIMNCDHLKELTIRAKEIKYDSIVTCKNLQTVNIGKEVEIICYGAFINVVPSNSKLTINCEVSERPSGWDMNWNIRPNYSSYFTTNWSVTF